ncbi:MAG: hypothetical protein KDD15_33185, partial [Lewinella sp.]|nr:hypothetical protein [Lewinella sp.]
GLIAIMLSFADIKENPLFLLGIGLYLYSILCGYLLIKGGKYKIVLSQINQSLQIMLFYVMGEGAYQYISGGYLAFGIDNTTEMKFRFLFGLLSEFELTIEDNYPINAVYINVLAVICFYLLGKYSEEEDLIDFILANQGDIDLGD